MEQPLSPDPAGRMRLRFPAPAKLNLFLHVTGRRDDGYHLLESLMVLLDFGDTVTLEPRDDGRIELLRPLPGVATEDDLTWRAAWSLQREASVRAGVTIALEKRIPMGAGLGGGSSDAATVLLALNKLWTAGLSRARLMEIGLGLGADVPFFVHGTNALTSGIGERLEPVSMPRCAVVIAMPPVASATRDIFAAQDLPRDTPPADARALPIDFGRNDLQPVAIARMPAIGAALRALDAVEFAAAGFVARTSARMTGSGAAVFRLAERARPAPAAGLRLAEDSALERAAAAGARIIHARVIPAHPLRDFAAK